MRATPASTRLIAGAFGAWDGACVLALPTGRPSPAL